MADLYENPMGLMGFEFIELASPTPNTLEPIFEIMGFTKVATHRSKDVHLYRQGAINLILNNEPNSVASYFAAEHGPSVCGMAFRVKDSQKAYNRALELGAQPIHIETGPMELNLPAIKGIGGAPLYLIDRFGEGSSIYDIDFVFLEGVDRHPVGAGLKIIDHLTHNVYRGRMAYWANFYEKLFNFREIRYFDIKGDDRAGRHDPHSIERRVVQGRRADRRVPDAVQRRGHPARGLPQRRPAQDLGSPEKHRHALHDRAAGHLL
jgi:4-hydroxyphenylpyruvate dioxygenase